MKKIVLIVVSIAVLLSCNQNDNRDQSNNIPEYISDIKSGKITYFKYNGISSETDGIFNYVYTDEPMWTLIYKDIDDVEKIIEKAIQDKKTNKGHPDVEPGLIEIELSDNDVKILKDLITNKNYYREYNIGTNKAYNKIIEISFYDSEKKEYNKLVRQIFCDIDNKVIFIRNKT